MSDEPMDREPDIGLDDKRIPWADAPLDLKLGIIEQERNRLEDLQMRVESGPADWVDREQDAELLHNSLGLLDFFEHEIRALASSRQAVEALRGEREVAKNWQKRIITTDEMRQLALSLNDMCLNIQPISVNQIRQLMRALWYNVEDAEPEFVAALSRPEEGP